jgi:hypothetical protein
MKVGTEVVIKTGKYKGMQATVFSVYTGLLKGYADVTFKVGHKLIVKEYSIKSLQQIN